MTEQHECESLCETIASFVEDSENLSLPQVIIPVALLKAALPYLNEHAKLMEYATHIPGCHENGEKCICGLDELLAEIEERNK